jgi:hypothetical protein
MALLRKLLTVWNVPMHERADDSTIDRIVSQKFPPPRAGEGVIITPSPSQ